MLDKKDFIKIGANVRDNYRTHIFTKALDVNDKKFKGYKEPYRSLKRSGKLKDKQGNLQTQLHPYLQQIC